MKQRGYSHSSDIDQKWKNAERTGAIDRKKNLEELLKRCSRCKLRYSEIPDFDS
jgi:hypothetical protein